MLRFHQTHVSAHIPDIIPFKESVDIVRLLFAYARSMPPQEQRRREYLSFQNRNGWHCLFLEQDLKTALPRKLHFASSDKVIELVERAGGFTDQDTRLMVNQAIMNGRGGLFLNLTAEQFSKLKHSGK